MAIYTRSPHYVSIGDSNISYATLNIYIWEGDKVTDFDSTPKYTLKKFKIGTSTKVSFEVSELIKDYIPMPFNGSFGGQVVWVKLSIEALDVNGANLDDEEYLDSAFDAYTYFENPIVDDNESILIDQRTVYLLDDVAYKLPIRTNLNPTVTVYLQSGTTTVYNFTSNNDSTEQVEYINTSGNNITKISIEDDVRDLFVYAKTLQECKYEPHKITFVNRYGVLQEMFFFKKSVEKMTVKKESYKANIFVGATSFEPNAYDTTNHVNRDFNILGNESISLSSGYLDEDYNEVFKQLMLSEKVWLTSDLKGTPKVIPVNVKTSNITYKTSLNDRLVEYTIDFENSFDTINNIR